MGKLAQAVKSQNIGDVKRILRAESPNDRDNYHQTPLHLACGVAANLEITKLLIKKKADVNVQERNGWTPLHCAANEGKLKICEMLLNTDGIDVGILNKDGTSVLHYLVRSNPDTADQAQYEEVLRLYIDKRGDIDSQSKHGESALHQSCLRGNITAVKFLLKNKAQINILNKIGETPLHYAVRASQKEIIQLLLEYGADTSLKSEDGTAFDMASSLEIANLIKQYSERSNKKSSSSAAEEVSQYPITDFKLRVKVIRAVNLTPVGEKDTASSYCQVSFNNQKKTNKPRPKTLSPKWNDVFLFDIEDLNYPLKISLYEAGDSLDAPAKEDLLGSITISLQDLQVDMSGEGNPYKGWYNIKRKPRRSGYKLTPKLRVEVSYILKSKLEETGQSARLAVDSDEENDLTHSGSATPGISSSTDSAGAFGVRRGKCKVDACDCDTYQPESARGGQCQNCGHWPAQHENLGKGESEPDSNSPSVAPANSGDGNADLSSQFSNATPHMLSHTWEINASELQFTTRLGEGTSAQVFKGTYRSQEVAIKVLKEKAEAKVLEEFQKEFEIMSSLRSPHVVFFYGATTQPSLCMVLEFCHKGALYDVLNDMREDIAWPNVFKAAIDTIKGLLCLHNWKPQIVHRDMKSLNLLVDENWATKVSDFGTSRFTSGTGVDLSTLGKLRGTYAYCAPEVYFGKNFTPKSDIYSFGVILWEMAFRCITGTYEQPFSEFKQIVFDFQIIIQSAKKDVRPTIPANCPQAYTELVNQCWHKDPDSRPTTEEVLQQLKQLETLYNANKTEWDSIRIPAVVPPEDES
eukprot:CAMPEP_0206201394 /NCGR_PEP_ID=MMETSP0166-20121206/11513_1 /ASSEMBLY_ACC=CAM_ASM_000260 /TAXON_ID=95228 /ORGANISM="Vannella robusta, Strain DIVA3 518/3/11/1/6" /LENGTH=805 /DNA_ID=CAMNT_0053620043 /DNA_START=36 /DNA_END=2449 /DNA_ORIENTATION=-